VVSGVNNVHAMRHEKLPIGSTVTWGKSTQIVTSLSFGIKIVGNLAYRLSYMFIMIQVSPHGRKSHSRYFILFNDMLMYCKMRCCPPTGPNSLRCCCILPLKKCTIDEILSKGMFKITCQNEVLILCSATAEEGDAWVSALRKAVKQVSYCTAKLIVRR